MISFSRLLAMFDNYHLNRGNASFDLDNKILPNHLGERIEGKIYLRLR
jgi:hypothetical protein